VYYLTDFDESREIRKVEVSRCRYRGYNLRSSNPEWLAVKCHVLAFEVSLGCEIQLVKIVLDRDKGAGALLKIGSPVLVFFLSESGLLG
jgi:hypothetical protein